MSVIIHTYLSFLFGRIAVLAVNLTIYYFSYTNMKTC